MVQQFISTVFYLAVANRWDNLTEYLKLIRDLLELPAVTITTGKPKDKEI